MRIQRTLTPPERAGLADALHEVHQQIFAGVEWPMFARIDGESLPRRVDLEGVSRLLVADGGAW